jgi:hypothetical protein
MAPTTNFSSGPVLENFSHELDMSNWKPDRTARIKNSNLYLWIVPAQVEGSLQLVDPAFADKPGSGEHANSCAKILAQAHRRSAALSSSLARGQAPVDSAIRPAFLFRKCGMTSAAKSCSMRLVRSLP